MALIESTLSLLYLVFVNFGSLVLIALGLGVIFGMMGIINLAHGEFIMVGAYTTAISYHQGVPLVVAILLAGVVTGIVGLIIERLVIHRLYDRIIDSMVATWGISLILTQTIRLVFGTTYSGIPTPFGTLGFASISASGYQVLLTIVAVLLLGLVYVVFTRTEYGLYARATIQNEEMARAMGVNTRRIYMVTFFFGSLLTGLVGGLFAPTIAIVPTLGTAFIIEAFVTVIVGGADIFIGVPLSSFILGVLNGGAAQWGGTLAGRVALLLTAILVIRIWPEGISTAVVQRRQ